MKVPKPPLAAIALLFALGGCGLQPMYAGGGSGAVAQGLAAIDVPPIEGRAGWLVRKDRKSTRLNSSHSQISYAVFCLKKKKAVILAAARINVTMVFASRRD